MQAGNQGVLLLHITMALRIEVFPTKKINNTIHIWNDPELTTVKIQLA
jgi:hypothetical protein